MIRVLPIFTKYADRIYSGEKKIELRRGTLGLNHYSVVLLYEVTPSQVIKGGILIDGGFQLKPKEMWKKYNPVLGISEQDFFKYFEGSPVACGYSIKESFLLKTPYTKEDLKRIDFVAPQGISTWTGETPPEVEKLKEQYNLRWSAERPHQLDLIK